MHATEIWATQSTTKGSLAPYRAWLIFAGAILAIVIAAAVIGARSISPWVRRRIVQTLEENFASRLELKSLDVSLFHRFASPAGTWYCDTRGERMCQALGTRLARIPTCSPR